LTHELDERRCEDLVARLLEGDAKARRSLIQELWPVWNDLVRRSRSLGSLATSKDHVEEIVTRLAEKFGQADGRALRTYVEWQRVHEDRTFADWNRIVTTNAIRDYVRSVIGTVRVPQGEPTPKRLLNELARSPVAQEHGVRPPFTAKQTARELLEFASSHLSSEQLRAMQLWLDDADFDEIGRELTVPPDAARKLVKAGIAVLRRHFGTDR
jgi:hypothetical protein